MSNGLPSIIIVGFANKAVDEAKERIRGAFASTNLSLPKKRITINLAPADVPKDDTSFDLAIATAILLTSGQSSSQPSNHEAFIGELGLNGDIKPVRGIIGKLLVGRKKGVRLFWIPASNLDQAKLVPNITLIPVSNLKDVALQLTQTIQLPRVETGRGSYSPHKKQAEPQADFKDIVGQLQAKRVLEIAAAGAHNALLNGPPGTGKSLLAKAMPSILPPLNLEEMLEITHLHSLAGRQFDSIIESRPFRAPHHSASNVSVMGGGQHPHPGEISLAHRGVLFFDEFPEFNRSAIEALRQPLEDRTITVSRAKGTVTYPADFILIATSNPCPCGYYGTSHKCRCLPHQIMHYEHKLSGPILDRIDLYTNVEEVEHAALLARSGLEESSAVIAKRVRKARDVQAQRFQSASKTNSTMSNADIKQYAAISDSSRAILDTAAAKLGLSPRSYMRIIKTARTIADLEDAASIENPHISEALQYRRVTTS